MLVSQLQPGMMLEPEPGFCFFIQESRESSLPRMRTAPDVIGRVFMYPNKITEDQSIMYLGETKSHILPKNTRKTKLRTVMVNGQVAFVEGRDFKNLKPIFS